MTQITLNIPDNELSFFMQLIEKFNYETVINEFSITEEMKICWMREDRLQKWTIFFLGMKQKNNCDLNLENDL